jgi:hypothetical protein
MTIEPEAQAFHHDLPARMAAGATEKVATWVRLNHAALLDFWRDGETWTRDEMNAFIDGLEKLARAERHGTGSGAHYVAVPT